MATRLFCYQRPGMTGTKPAQMSHKTAPYAKKDRNVEEQGCSTVI